MRLLDRYPPIVVNDRDDLGSNPTASRPIEEILEARFGRRQLLRSAAAGTAVGLFGAALPGTRLAMAEEEPKVVSTLTFEELEHGIDETHHVAKGYSAKCWFAGATRSARIRPPSISRTRAPPPRKSSSATTATLSPTCRCRRAPAAPRSGLLCVNHEYTNPELMFPGMTEDDRADKDHQGPGRGRDGRARAQRRRNPPRGGQVARGSRQPSCPADLRQHEDEHRRPGRRSRPPQDRRRSHRHDRARHPQQLCGRPDALEYGPDGRRELQLLFRRRARRGPAGSRLQALWHQRGR